MNRKRIALVMALVMYCGVLVNTACSETKTENSNQKTNTQNKEKKEAYNPDNSSGKTYQKMSEAEQNKFVAKKTDEFLQKLGFDKSDKINGKGLEMIKPFVDGYAKRIDSKAKDKCGFGDNLAVMLKRGSEAAETIGEEFKVEKVSSETGLYLAMIESEFCPCLQSPTGPLGMFQLTRAKGKEYGLEVKRDASPTNPDQRCEIKPGSSAAAKYIKSIQDKLDTKGSIKTVLAINQYNFGDKDFEISEEIKKAPNSQESVWLILADDKKPNPENAKYLPKFIAAGIVGESPKVFGVDISPLSQVK